MKPIRIDENAYEPSDIGESLEHQRAATVAERKEVDDALGLEKITIRLQKDLVDELKKLAKDQGLGYQPYVRQILTNHVKNLAKAKRLAVGVGP
jgi:predicted DNA binding CopG/RHH family protein